MGSWRHGFYVSIDIFSSFIPPDLEYHTRAPTVARKIRVSDTLSTVILGIVEGVTEFLPISSTGHLLIAEQFLGERTDLFNVAIQAGAILAILLIYQRRLIELVGADSRSGEALWRLTPSGRELTDGSGGPA